MTGPLKLRLGDRTVWIVRSSDVESWSRERAAAMLGEVACEWPGRASLMRISDLMLGPGDEVGQAIGFVADAIDRGRLLAVRMPDAGEGLSSEAADAWEDAPLLSDLGTKDDDARQHPRATPGVPRLPDDPGGAVDPGATFVAFAVFDQHGKPLAGRAECKVDAARHAHALEHAPIDIRPIPPHAHIELTLRELSVPEAASQ